jgi:tRNA-specific 2-thiouridylase
MPVRVAVAMSGGVDSLRAAALLRHQGHDIIALHMRLLPDSPNLRWDTETSLRTRENSLRTLAARLDVPLYIVELRAAFDVLVIQPFLAAYQRGLTPNPCIVCNPRIKFGLLLNEARRFGVDRLATGHYAQLQAPDEQHPRFRLQRGRDPAKDQSYFLYGLTQDQLAAAAFPLGNVCKQEVQRWAEESGFADQVPEESQEICFIPAGHYREFLEERLGPGFNSQQGDIVDLQGTLLGRHMGITHYTIGQRRGLGLASSAPYYVVALDSETNRVVVGRAANLYRQELTATELNWLAIDPPNQPLRCQVRIRNQHQPAPAELTPKGENEVLVRFDEPQRAITPGQAAVFYDQDLVLGGGIITREPQAGSRGVA